MLKNITICSLLILAFISCGDTKPDGANQKMTLEDVNWIVGKWQDDVNSSQWEEWEKTEQGYYGRGMFIKNGDTSLFEKMTISLEGNKLMFIAIVEKNSEPVKFIATELTPNKVVFENPQHDFPQYISYTYNQSKNVLQAEVKGGEKGFIVEMIGR